MRDGFVKQLAMIWKGYGGQISHAEDGPLLSIFERRDSARFDLGRRRAN